MGRPAIDPVRMLKILFLRFHYKLSDRQVMERTKTDMAFRWFLDLPLQGKVPNHTDGTYFRKRIGAERFAQVFQELVTQAREAGLVKDRLRLKDATHLHRRCGRCAAAAVGGPGARTPAAGGRPVFRRLGGRAAGPDRDVAANDGRVCRRRTLGGACRTPAGDGGATARARRRSCQRRRTERPRQRLRHALELVDKLLADRSDPQAKDRLASAVDPDARVGKHGGYFVGYLLDMAIDPDSELITSLNVLPGNGAEAADAITLIRARRNGPGQRRGRLVDGRGRLQRSAAA